MEIQLRFGMHRDKPIIHDEVDLIDGLVVPAHIISYNTPSTSVFVTSLAPFGVGYALDPMTFMYQSERRSLVNDDGDIRPSIEGLSEEYHPELVGSLRELDDPEDRLSPRELPSPNQLSDGVVGFQLRVVQEGSDESSASKYLRRYGQVEITTPRVVVPPYLYFRVIGNGAYDYSLECARYVANQDVPCPVQPVICCPPSALGEEEVRQIASDYREFDRLFVWIDDLRERDVHSRELERVRRLLRTLSQNTARIESLYGGYMLMLAEGDGLDAVSHGILYTQHKSVGLTPGGGGPPERFYIPRIHQFRSLSQTDYILQREPELMCDCQICEERMGGDPDRIIEYADNPELLRRHFLRVRRREADRVPEFDLDRETERLERTYDRFHDSLRDLPNPDAISSESRMPGLNYLTSWADGFDEEVEAVQLEEE